ncbi:MAG TPA: TadE/TadG family type IV pilus assembly protein [Caulobacteraceae bacterium]|jgi:Flp pilus assembly protein TadG
MLWRRLLRDRRGVSAVEFALIAPLLLVLYAGLSELCQAMIAERRAGHVASAVGDLVAQAEVVTINDLNDIFTIGKTIMNPFPQDQLKVCVTSVTADANKVTKVDWRRGSDGGACSTGSTVTIPLDLAEGDSVVMAETSYAYTSPIKYILPNALSFQETFYLRPRRSDKVVCNDCPPPTP